MFKLLIRNVSAALPISESMKIRHKSYMRNFAAFLILIVSMSVQAQLEVSKTTLELSESNPRTTVRISNTGSDTLYVKMNIDQLLDPANDESLRKPIDLMSSPEILVLPQQLVLEAGQTKIVRVVTTNANVDSDQVYRLNVAPFAGSPLLDGKETRSYGVKILFGYKLLVLVRPENIAPKVDYQVLDNSLNFTNTGNTSVLLREIEACSLVGENCEKLAANRLYPGEILNVDIPQNLQSKAIKVKTRQAVRHTENLVEY